MWLPKEDYMYGLNNSGPKTDPCGTLLQYDQFPKSTLHKVEVSGDMTCRKVL